MCGIFCCVNSANTANCLNAKEIELLTNRGPNTQGRAVFENAVFGGFVLWQQGAASCRQPVDGDDLILLFNGDVFGDACGKAENSSDTFWLSQVLAECADDEDILKVLRSIHGPYSIVFLRRSTKDLYFARDSLGRNSLLIEKTATSLKLLSASHFEPDCVKETRELPPVGLFKINLNDIRSCDVYPWCSENTHWDGEIENLKTVMDMEFQIKQCIRPPWLDIQLKAELGYDFYDLCRDISEDSDEVIVQHLISQPTLMTSIDHFGRLLENSVRDRVVNTPAYCKNCLGDQLANCRHSKIAILFSGGVDCTVLAILVDKLACPDDSIDLINVAFEKDKSTSSDWKVPDRLSSYDSLEELKRLCPKRDWNFVEVNVSRAELHTAVQNHIKHLIYPLNTILDESLGCAFWFASRGQGICDGKEYNSPARVIIVGSGADELFGGYVRHRNAYKRCPGTELDKNKNVHEELERDWHRIPSRNLARDDRVIGDNGKTSRAPFLEENVVQYVRFLKANQRCCYMLREGLGDKLFLRLYAHQLGLRGATVLKKRAIQFGSKIAIKSQNATDISKYLKG